MAGPTFFCPSEDEPDLPNTPEIGLMAIDSQNPFVQPFDEDIRPRILKYLEGGGITDSSVTVCDSSEDPTILVGGTLDAVQKTQLKEVVNLETIRIRFSDPPHFFRPEGPNTMLSPFLGKSQPYLGPGCSIGRCDSFGAGTMGVILTDGSSVLRVVMFSLQPKNRFCIRTDH